MEKGAWQATVHKVVKTQIRLKRLSKDPRRKDFTINPHCCGTEAPAVKSPSKVTQGKQGRQDSLPGIRIQQKLEDREPLGLRKKVAISFKYNGK